MGLTTSGGMRLGLMSSWLCLVLCATAFRTVALMDLERRLYRGEGWMSSSSSGRSGDWAVDSSSLSLSLSLS